jgi:hypothetical protein
MPLMTVGGEATARWTSWMALRLRAWDVSPASCRISAAMKLGVQLNLTDVRAVEFHCLLILEEEVQLLDVQKLSRNPG